MAAFVKFHDFAEQLGKGVHNLHTHTLKVYLTNATPNAATHAVKADIAEITAQNGYTAGGADVQNTYTESGGVGTLAGVDVTWTATGGSFGPFRYVVLYNDDPTSPADPLIGYWDYSQSISPQSGDTFTADFGASLLTVT